MAIDDLLRFNVGTIQGYIGGSFDRWIKAAMRARGGNYPAADLYKDAVDQFLDGWDTWTGLMSFMLEDTPTVEIVGPAGSINLMTGSTFIRGRLGHLDAANAIVVTATMQVSDLEQFGGANTIPGNTFSFTPSGDFLGTVIIKTTDTVPKQGTYRGIAMMQFTTRNGAVLPYQPLCWIVVRAE